MFPATVALLMPTPHCGAWAQLGFPHPLKPSSTSLVRMMSIQLRPTSETNASMAPKPAMIASKWGAGE